MSRGFGSKIKVRVKRPWGKFAIGAVINPPAMLRDVLIAKDVVELVPEEVPAVEIEPEETPDEEPKPKRRKKKDD